jgi:hypothetical protein
MSFEDMGPQWVPVRDAVQAGTLRANDKAALDVAANFDALIRYAALRLGRRLGAEVTPVLSRTEVANPTLRMAALATSLVKSGTFESALRIPNTVSDLRIVADLRASKIACSFDIDAPREGRATTRINWLTRQLRDSPDGLRIEAHFARGRADAAELLRDVRENPAKLVIDPAKEIKSFTITHGSTAGAKRSAGRGGFIDSMLAAVDASYEEIGQRLKAWAATPPRLRSDDEVEVEIGVPASLPSAALSSQDE